MLKNDIKSIWMEFEAEEHLALNKDLNVEIAIIGGGMAGILTAYYLIKAGQKNIAIFEAGRILSGTTGNTTAKVTITHELKYDYLKNKFDLESAKIYADSNQWAIEELKRLIAENKIDCDFYQTKSNLYSVTNDGLKELEKEFEVMQEIGLPCTFLNESKELPFKITGEIKLENQALFHPKKFLIAVAEMLIKGGVQIFEDSRVEEVKEGALNILKIGNKKVSAKSVILATNYPIYDKAAFFLRMNQTRSYALAAQLNTEIPDEMFINIDGPGLTLRPYESEGKKWAIVGGQDQTVGQIKKENPFEELEKNARNHFDVNSVDYLWAAQDSTTIDRVPYIGKMPLTKNIYLCTGFGEWGMTTSFVSAKILADEITGIENRWSKLYSPNRFNPIASLKQTGSLLGHVAEGFGSYVTKIKKYDSEMIGKGSGKVMQDGKNKVAAYKDDNGKMHLKSAVCTHMGCIVNFNEAEKSWDCPCHGSRFSVDGEILNDPAIKPLKDIEE